MGKAETLKSRAASKEFAAAASSRVEVVQGSAV